MNRIKSLTITSFMFLALVLPPDLYAQPGQISEAPDLRNWSVQVHGGSYLSNINLRFTPFTGSTGIPSRVFNPAVGAEIEYMFSPSLALKAGFIYSDIRSDLVSNPYRNEYQSASLALNIYLLKLFESRLPFGRVNPYLSLRAGQTRASYSEVRNKEPRTGTAGHYGYALGARIYLTDRFDLTALYHYTYYNPAVQIDGGPSGRGQFENDRVVGLLLGVSLKLGGSDRPHARWHPRARRAGVSDRVIFI